MKLQYPYALLLLLAIPVLILIYILRNKYREETAPSTYIWELSQKFMKKRNPLRKVEHLLALIVEILTIAGMSLALAHPAFVLTGKADNIVFVLDGSASMNMTHEENKTRFESAKEQIAKVAKDAKTGSAFTLILASDQAHVVCESVTDKTRFEMYLDSTKASYLSATLDDSMTVAQQLMSNGTTNVCYLATDKKILETYTKNVNVLSVYDDSKNYAINSLSYVYYPVSSKREKPQIGISGTATSYTCDEKLRIHFYVNDESIGYADFDTKANTPLVLSLPDQDVTYTSADAIKSVKAVIDNEDALMLDNTFTVYNNEAGSTTRVLVVSDSPFYFKAIFQALNNVSATIVSSSSYSSSYTGYDITVFDSYTPSALPKTGAVWFFGSDTVSDCG
ncbi:MAG: VWA domain-containing protein, partial [Bacilli bacterium]